MSTSKGVYAAIAEREQRIKDMVLAAGLVGISSSSIQKTMQLSDGIVWKHLRALADSGEIEASHKGGHTTKWGAPGIYAAYAAERKRAAQRNEAKLARRKAREDAARWKLPKADNEDFERKSVKRRVDASKVPPIRVAVPNSVWQLGQILNATRCER